ncbi:MAG: hypothetical protein NTY38_14135 [Acidobacteria bacterium]|nr:hypothetical protein [Acidobacteriota bacterium]
MNSSPAGFDRWDILHAFAPKPLLVMASAHDFFGTYSPNYLRSGREEFALLRGLYEKLGRGPQLDWYETPMPHGLAYDYRLRIYNWFGRFLLPGFQPITEEPSAPRESEQDLQVTTTGSLVGELHSATPFRILAAQPVEPKPLLDILKVDRPPANLQARTLAQVRFANSNIQTLEVLSAPNVWVPAWLYQPRGKAAAAPVLVAVSTGARAQWREGALWDSLAAEGFVTCPIDIRGVGDLRPNFGHGNPPHARAHQEENHYVWASLILGKPLLGQRVTDILAVMAALRNHPGLKGRRFVLAASGPMAVPALFAAALDPQIEALHLSGGLVSFRNLLETEHYAGGRYERNGNPEANNAVNIAFGLLQATDLPQLAAAIAPRKLVLSGALDAAGALLSEAKVKAIYAHASHVDVRPPEPWTPQSLATWLRALSAVSALPREIIAAGPSPKSPANAHRPPTPHPLAES